MYASARTTGGESSSTVVPSSLSSSPPAAKAYIYSQELPKLGPKPSRRMPLFLSPGRSNRVSRTAASASSSHVRGGLGSPLSSTRPSCRSRSALLKSSRTSAVVGTP